MIWYGTDGDKRPTVSQNDWHHAPKGLFITAAMVLVFATALDPRLSRRGCGHTRLSHADSDQCKEQAAAQDHDEQCGKQATATGLWSSLPECGGISRKLELAVACLLVAT